MSEFLHLQAFVVQTLFLNLELLVKKKKIVYSQLLEGLVGRFELPGGREREERGESKKKKESAGGAAMREMGNKASNCPSEPKALNVKRKRTVESLHRHSCVLRTRNLSVPSLSQ